MAVPITDEEKPDVILHGKAVLYDEVRTRGETYTGYTYNFETKEEDTISTKGTEISTNVHGKQKTKNSSYVVMLTTVGCIMVVLKRWIAKELESKPDDDKNNYVSRQISKMKNKLKIYEGNGGENPKTENILASLVKILHFIPNAVYQTYMLYPQDYNKFIDEKQTDLESCEKDSMQFEWCRLSTFATFPTTNLSVIRLAEAGFYYQGNGDEVVCHFCGLKYRHWKATDNPKLIHRELSSNCSFVKNLNASTNDGGANNTEIDVSNAIAAPNGACGNQADIESISVAGKNRPANERNYSLENTNGPYCKQNNMIKAEYSENTSQSSSDITVPSDVPRNEVHGPEFGQRSLQTLSPFSNATNITTAAVGNLLTFQSRPNQELNIFSRNDTTGLICVPANTEAQQPSMTSQRKPTQSSSTCHLEPGSMGVCVDKPKYPKYAVRATRLSSFTNWPLYLTQKPEDLAVAGFFYTGTEDHCRCFFCGGGLRRWETGDLPWTEHARWYPKCSFVRQCKGDKFVDDVQRGNDPERVEIREYEDQNKKTKGLNGYTNNPVVQTILEFGYDTNVVKTAYTSLKQSGIQDIIASLLLETIYEMEESKEQPVPPDKNVCNEEKPRQQTSEPKERKKTEENAVAMVDPSLELSIKSLEEENRNLKDQQTCKICLDEPVAIVFLPCGHMAACVNCAPALRRCPICRAFIKGTVKAIMC